ncbi:AbfB domain-containing protein [Streptomyces sp. NPDC007905]|uniref:AbfB domain-containing protein n=1 Tax=Streptomyces sp. NPDC007905 TaxID=3364788 RepID=UPI0036EEE216
METDAVHQREQDAVFCPRTSSFSGAVMLESVNYPGRFLRHQDFRLGLDPYQNTDLYRADSAFLLVDGVA